LKIAIGHALRGVGFAGFGFANGLLCFVFDVFCWEQ